MPLCSRLFSLVPAAATNCCEGRSTESRTGWSRPPVRTASRRAGVAFLAPPAAAVSSVCVYHFRFTNGLRVCETLGCVRAVSFPLLTSLGSPAAVEIENASLSAGLGCGSSQDCPPTCLVTQGSRVFSNPEGNPANIWASPPLCEGAVAGESECVNW